jgi:membrane protein
MIKRRARTYKVVVERYLTRKARGIVLPGERGLSVYDVGKYLLKEVTFLRLQERVAAVTYSFLMAIPPTLLFLFSLVPYLPLKNVEQTILNALKMLTPNRSIYNSVSKVVVDFMRTQHHSILSFGLLLVLYYASNGMMGLMKTFDRSMSLFKSSQNLYKKRGPVRRRWTAIKLTIILISMMIVMIAVLIIQNKRFIQNRQLHLWVLKVFKNTFMAQTLSYTILVLVVFLSICTIYRYGPSLKHKFKFVSFGAIFATLSSLAATSVFFFLVNNFLNYNKVYGSIGTLMAFMVWVWMNTGIILLGYEINVSILLGKLAKEQKQKARKNKEIEGDE